MHLPRFLYKDAASRTQAKIVLKMLFLSSGNALHVSAVVRAAYPSMLKSFLSASAESSEQ